MHTKRQHIRAGLFVAPDRRRFKGSSGTNTTTTDSGPSPQVLANYQQAYNQASNVTSQPYQAYSGSAVAGFTPMQQSGFNAVNTAANAGQPFINQASQDVTNSTTALNGQNFGNTVSQYQSPYTQQVVNATTAQLNNQDAIQQNQLAGNAASAGAFGGDRQGVAQAVLGGQQAIANNATIANLNNTGFQNATSAAQSNAWLNSQGASLEGSLGNEAQNQGETAAQSMLSAGQTQQTQAQNELNVPYESYLAAQAYPYQATNYLANIAEGTGSLSGGTSTTTSPGASTASQIGGLGLAAYGLYRMFADGGAVPGGATGNTNSVSLGSGVPDFSISLIPWNSGSQAHGSTIPQSPRPTTQNSPSLQSEIGTMGSMGGKSGLKGLGSDLKNLGSQIGGWINGTNPDDNSSLFGMSTGMQNMTNSAVADAALTPPDFGPGNASRGGAIDFGGHRPLHLGLGDAVYPRRARGGFMPLHRDDGGATPAGLTASVGGNPALVQLTQAYSGLPTEQLQEMASRSPPNSPQGSMAQRALRMRQMNPASNPAQPSVQTGQPSGQAQQQAGFAPQATPQGFADGGAPVGDPYAPSFDVTPAIAALWGQYAPGAQDRASTDLRTAPSDADPNVPSVDLRGASAAIAGLGPISSDSPQTHAAYYDAGYKGMLSAGLSPREAQDIVAAAPRRGLSDFKPSDFSSDASPPAPLNYQDARLSGGFAPRVTVPAADEDFDMPQPGADPSPAPSAPSAQPFSVSARAAGFGASRGSGSIPIPPDYVPPDAGTQDHPTIIGVQQQSGMGPMRQQPANGTMKPNIGEALLTAGLAMMAGRSPHAMENIGQGGLAGVQNYQQQRQLDQQDALRQQQAQWQNDYRQQMAQNGANRNDNTLAVAQLRSADARTRQAMQVAMMKVAAGHMSAAEGEQSLINKLMLPPEKGGEGMSLPDAIEASKGFAGRASRAQQGIDLRGSGQDAMTQYRQWQMAHGDASLAEQQHAHDWAINHGLTEEQIQQRGQTQEVSGKTLSPVPATIVPQRNAPVSSPSLPKVGDVKSGYTYKGGNPADPASWIPQ